MNVSLTNQLESYVQQKVATGMYNSASEVIREALRLMAEKDSEQSLKLAALRADIQQGIASVEAGQAGVFDPEQIKARARLVQPGEGLGMLLIAPEAEQDLVDIWLFIAEDSPANADNFVDRLYAQARQLAEFPLLGKLRADLGDRIYLFPMERYLLFYQPMVEQDGGIVLVRVLHSARDIQQL